MCPPPRDICTRAQTKRALLLTDPSNVPTTTKTLGWGGPLPPRSMTHRVLQPQEPGGQEMTRNSAKSHLMGE